MIEEVTKEQLDRFEKLSPDEQIQKIQDTIHSMMVDHLGYFQTVKDLTELPFKDPESKQELEEGGVTQESLAKQNFEEMTRVKESSEKLIKDLIEEIKSEIIKAAEEQDKKENGEFKMVEKAKKGIEDSYKKAMEQTKELEKKLGESLSKEQKTNEVFYLNISTHAHLAK